MTKIIDKSADEIYLWMKNNLAFLVDVREDHEFNAAHIPNTDIHLPLSRFDPLDIPANSSKKLVFICAQGVRSLQAGQYLLENGYIEEAYNLKDGIAGWHSAGFQLEPN